MILDTVNKSLEVVLGEAATPELDVTVAYADITDTTFTAKSSDTTTDGTTPVTVAAAPAAGVQRQVKEVTVYNADNIPHTVFLQLNNNSTVRVLYEEDIDPGQTFTYRYDALRGAAGATGATGATGAAGVDGDIIPTMPEGRLTLVANTPVMTSSQAGKTTVYYTPYVGQLCPLYDGSSFTMHDLGGELSQATTDNTKSPAAMAASKLYDMFVWLDGSTYRCTRGLAWTDDTTRAAGLTMVDGILLNTSAVTNGPGALRGTYVGTIRSNGSSQMDWIPGGIASGGTAAFLYVWNMHNRVDVATFVGDSDNSWTYNSTTVHAANNGSTARRISFVVGLAEDCFSFFTYSFNLGGTTNAPVVGLGVDVTNAFSGLIGQGSPTAIGPAFGIYNSVFAAGAHFVQDCEAVSSGTAVCTFYGDAGAPTLLQTGMTGELRM